MSADQTQPFHGDLPIELWGEILTQVNDPYDLWVNCRQVSSLFKHEAERAFRSQHLARMMIRCIKVDKKEQEDGHLAWGMCVVELRLDAKQKALESASARFRLETTSMYTNPERSDTNSKPMFVKFRSESHRDRMIHQCLDRHDLGAMSRSEEPDLVEGGLHAMKVAFFPDTPSMDHSLGYVNDIEFPEMTIQLDAFSRLEVDAKPPTHEKQGHATFDWKSFVTAFFAEEIFVRRDLERDGISLAPPPSLQGIFADTLILITERCPSLELSEGSPKISEEDRQEFEALRKDFIAAAVASHGSHHMYIYEAAYDARLRKAFAKHGRVKEADTCEFMLHVHSHISHMQKYRDRRFTAMAEDYWRLQFREAVIGKVSMGNDTEDDDDEDESDNDEDSDDASEGNVDIEEDDNDDVGEDGGDEDIENSHVAD